MRFKIVEKCKNINEKPLNEVKLNTALDYITDYIKKYLNRNHINHTQHPIEVFPVYELGLVKVVFKGTGVSYTIVPGKLDNKNIIRKRPIRLLPTYNGAIYKNGCFYDTSGNLIGDAYVSVDRKSSESDYSVDMNDLIIKSSDTMKDFRTFVHNLGTDAANGSRIP